MPRRWPQGRSRWRKAKFDGDTAFFFFFQAIGFNAGESPDEGGLAMVDMAGGTKDYFTHASS